MRPRVWQFRVKDSAGFGRGFDSRRLHRISSGASAGVVPGYSYLVAGLLPDARLTIYPDSAHGFLFQHHSRFAADVSAFLAEAGRCRGPGRSERLPITAGTN
jgi:hypothetical protein